MVIVTLEHMTEINIRMSVADSEHRAFSSMDEAEMWLKNNHFYYGQRNFLKYTPPDGKEWCHKKDAYWEYIKVSFEIIEDQNKQSRYRDFDPGISPYLKAAYEDGLL